jgi:Protein of unknown function (DUF2809)
MTGRSIYFIAAVIILMIEIAIALGIGGAFIRGSVGDILVIVLIYCLLRTFPIFPPITAAITAVATGFLDEALQYINISERLRLQAGSILYIIIGNTFSPHDLLMYLMGGGLALTIDRHILTPLKNQLTRPNG